MFWQYSSLQWPFGVVQHTDFFVELKTAYFMSRSCSNTHLTWELAASRVSENLCHRKGRYCQLCLTEAGREQQSIKAASAGPHRCSSSLVWFHTAEQGLSSVPSQAAVCTSACPLSATRWLPDCNSAPAAAHQMSTGRKPCPDNQVQITLHFVIPDATSTKYVLHV